MASLKYTLSSTRRLRIIIEIAHNTGVNKYVVAKSNRTDAQLVALARDTKAGNFCAYHRWGLKQNREIHDVHHIFGRYDETDWPAFCISLCFECHRNVTEHHGHPTDNELLALARRIAAESPSPYSDIPPKPSL